MEEDTSKSGLHWLENVVLDNPPFMEFIEGGDAGATYTASEQALLNELKTCVNKIIQVLWDRRFIS